MERGNNNGINRGFQSGHGGFNQSSGFGRRNRGYENIIKQQLCIAPFVENKISHENKEKVVFDPISFEV